MFGGDSARYAVEGIEGSLAVIDYTVEYYRAVDTRLREGGLFLQWLQGDEVDLETVKTIVATVAEVFPEIVLWQTEARDLQLVCSRERQVLDARMRRQRIGWAQRRA